MKLTRNAKIFAVIGAVITVLFFPILDWLIPNSERHGAVAVAGFVYGLIWFLSGLLLGKNDQNRNYHGDLGMLYHLITNVIVSVGGILAFLLLNNFGFMDTLWTLGIAWVLLLIHWISTRNSVKGIDKKEAFK